jgi:nucleoid-associated protein YgaU
MAQQDQRLEQLKQKYQSVLNAIQQSGVRLDHVHVQDNKLFIQGTAPSEEVKNRIWDQIKLVDPGYSDLTADIQVSATAPSGQAQTAGAAVSGGGGRRYTVKAGDTLSKISREFYGEANQYMKIFNANRDKLQDPDKIQPGQELVIPS